MQALILAAGLGNRLGDLTRTSAKCMLSMNGRRLIERMLDSVVEAGIDRAIVVVGHGAAELQSFLGTSYRALDIQYVFNPMFACSNNIYSALLAGPYLAAEDTLLLESDLVFEQSIIQECLCESSPDIAVVAKYQLWMDGTVVTVDDDKRISSFITKTDLDLTRADTYFKTVNIYKLSREFCRELFVPLLRSHIALHGANSYYEEVFKYLGPAHPGRLTALMAGDRLWYEIDTLEDLARAERLFSAAGSSRLYSRAG